MFSFEERKHFDRSQNESPSVTTATRVPLQRQVAVCSCGRQCSRLEVPSDEPSNEFVAISIHRTNFPRMCRLGPLCYNES